MRGLKHMLYSDGHGEIAIIFPDLKSNRAISGIIINKNNDMKYELNNVFLIRESGVFNDYWHIQITRTMMDSIEAKHKFDLEYEIN